MNAASLHEQLRRIYVDRIQDWDTDYEAFIADVELRVGRLATVLAKITGSAVNLESPTGDVQYYALEAALKGPSNRFRIEREQIEEIGGEALYLVGYCSTLLPIVELRWHSIRSLNGQLARSSCDVLDDHWCSEHPECIDIAIQVVAAAEAIGWQILVPQIAEQPAPKDWPWPFPTYDYQNGAYLVRDYVIKGMRDY